MGRMGPGWKNYLSQRPQRSRRKKIENPISGEACKLVKSENDGFHLELMRELTKKNLCVLSELCERKKINRIID